MSDKIPISLHNSDLFLNPDLRLIDRERINTDVRKDFISKRTPSLGENNQFVSLPTSDILPPLHSSPYINQAVKQYLLTKREIANRSRDAQLERNKDQVRYDWNDKQTFGKGKGKTVFPLRYELRSGLTPRSKAQVVLNKRENREQKVCFEDNKELLPFKQGGNKDNSTQDNKLDTSTKSTLPGLSVRFLDLFNRGISSSISREFLVLTINLILLSVLAIVHRSHYGKGCSITKGRGFLTTLCQSKMSNITSCYPNPTGVREHVYDMRLRDLNLSQERFVGVFLGNRSQNICRTESAKTDCKSLHLPRTEKIVGFAESQPCTYVRTKGTLPTASPQKSIGFRESVIQPWYCIKVCNSANNNVVPVRAFSQIKTNVPLCNDNQVRGVEYYLPFYKSEQRILAESDTIPSKRDTVYLLKARDVYLYRKLEPSSWLSISQSVANKYFYKHGLLLASPLKGARESGIKEREQVPLVRLRRSDEMYPRSDVKEFEKDSVDKINLHNPLSDSTILIPKTEVDCRTAPRQDRIMVKNSYILLGKRNCESFGGIKSSNFVNNVSKRTLTLHKDVESLRTSQTLAKPVSMRKREEISFTALKTSTQESPFFVSSERFENQSAYLNSFSFVRTTLKNLLPTVGESNFVRCSLVCTKICNLPPIQEYRSTNKPFFPLGFAWSHFDLSKLTLTAFIPMQNTIQIFRFTPDSLPRNSSLSGYKLPLLKEEEICYLFRKTAILESFFNCNDSKDKTLLQRLLTQLTTVFRHLRSHDLVCQAVSNSLLPDQSGVMVVNQGDKNRLREQNINLINPRSKAELLTKTKQIRPSCTHAKQGDCKTNKFEQLISSPGSKNQLLTNQNDGVKMQYTQVDLNEIKDISSLFKELGQDYKEYLRQPKDSLPALVISPSLEDDREIEEEGIQIFRKRDLVKNKRSELGEKSDESNIESYPSFLTQASESLAHKTISRGTPRKDEMQNHQLLVRNALQQAQEEIDNIAKKEEKGTEKEKQVVPPLTRLEALYTIRNRERKHEQAKDFKSDKNTAFYQRSNRVKLPLRGNTRVGVVPSGCKNEVMPKQGFGNAQSGQTTERTSLPIFERLFLYSDRVHESHVNQHPRQSENTVDRVRFEQVLRCKNPVFAQPSLHVQKPRTSELTRWVFSKLGDRTICTDRKHSFFGELSLHSKRLSAQEQKQVFQQKANPLLKVSGRDTRSAQGTTVPLSLLSQFSALSKPNYNKNEVPRFQVGSVIAKSCFLPKVNHLLLSTPFSEETPVRVQELVVRTSSLPIKNPDTCADTANTEHLRSLPNLFLSKNRIYFYDTFSQNRGCQSSAPRIKNTPLQSPVSHRAWQPKRMEPSTFRVSQRNKGTQILPRITQQDWKKIMEWQLRKYLVEEKKRLFSASLKNKQAKIKLLNLYLPWISLQKPNNVIDATLLLNKGSLLSVQQSSQWPLTRLDLTKSLNDRLGSDTSFIEQDVREDSSTFGFVKQLPKTNPNKSYRYWQLPIQRKLYTTTVCKSRAYRRSLHTINTRTPVTSSNSRIFLPNKKEGIFQKVFNSSILFEPVTRYSWLFIYTLASLFIFKQFIALVYKLGLKDFFINFLNSDFGRTITSEEFRYSVQNSPLTEFYRPTKRLDELFGLERNRTELLEIVWFLRNNCQGRHGVRGILLVGPPGVESVSVLQAIAGEANLPIIVQSLEKIAQDNEPQRQLEQVYMRAHKQAPCVLFLDQLDSVGARRDQLFTDTTLVQNGNPLISLSSGQDKQVLSSFSSPSSFSSCKNEIFATHVNQSGLTRVPETVLYERHGETNGTISSYPFQNTQNCLALQDQDVKADRNGASDLSFHPKQDKLSLGNKLNVLLRLLTILDGITQSKGVVTVATARDVTRLDPALLRPKRFDRRIYLSLPNQQDRAHLFKIQTQSIGHIKEMPWNYLSLQTENMSAADIRSAINYSLFRAILRNSVHTVETLEYGISCVKSLTDQREYE